MSETLPAKLCSEPRCAALATVDSTCPVHARAHQGPYSSPCFGCKQPITKHDLWVRHASHRGTGVEQPYHQHCRPGAPKPAKAKRAKKGWDDGLGMFHEPESR